MATAEGTVVTFNHSISPFHSVMLPRLGSRDVLTTLRKYGFFGFHSNLNRSVYPDFVIIATGDVPAIGHVGPGKIGMDEV
jgi:hypothetical protein